MLGRGCQSPFQQPCASNNAPLIFHGGGLPCGLTNKRHYNISIKLQGPLARKISNPGSWQNGSSCAGTRWVG
jgi:hypothetical protein